MPIVNGHEPSEYTAEDKAMIADIKKEYGDKKGEKILYALNNKQKGQNKHK